MDRWKYYCYDCKQRDTVTGYEPIMCHNCDSEKITVERIK